MILILEDTYLDLDKVHSIIIRYDENKKIASNVRWWNPFTWGSFPTVTTDPKFTLTMDYGRGQVRYTYTCQSTDYATMRTRFKKIVEQLKTQVDATNQEMLDRLFEQALLEGDAK